MIFITLTRAAAGDPISVNVDHITCMLDVPAPSSGTQIELSNGGLVRVVETRAEILEIARLRDRTEGSRR